MPLHSNNVSREDLISRYFPQYRIVAPQTHAGFSGASCIIEQGEHRLILRQHHDLTAPAFCFRRQCRALRRLPADLVPKPHFFSHGWMAVEYLAGEIESVLPDTQTLAGMLYHLHRQSRLGWRITLLPLLNDYWQRALPSRRTPFWLATLKRLRQRGEPQPLRLVPLHMDVHAGNIVHTPTGERLIDWEYAGDGDVALELAAVWMPTETSRQALVQEYAQKAQMDPGPLWHQVNEWQPWVLMMMAGWYELRLRQSGDKQFIALADDVWRRLQTKG
ncbi:thiamine kinase [Lelliottia sp. CFBP8978]|uniref:thiamine kinase n=1 Tax=Lelliottia sp. CFBP8978 TaxID=3096522 RepID=UPI002A6A5F1E|nr:thiamine kinase [Lelliottia sp. CFBP8978]MDY1038460.1 thiamine kinase [Lelliottia sp. CFBP8978]